MRQAEFLFLSGFSTSTSGEARPLDSGGGSMHFTLSRAELSNVGLQLRMLQPGYAKRIANYADFGIPPLT